MNQIGSIPFALSVVLPIYRQLLQFFPFAPSVLPYAVTIFLSQDVSFRSFYWKRKTF